MKAIAYTVNYRDYELEEALRDAIVGIPLLRVGSVDSLREMQGDVVKIAFLAPNAFMDEVALRLNFSPQRGDLDFLVTRADQVSKTVKKAVKMALMAATPEEEE